jgi:hypothetical protein
MLPFVLPSLGLSHRDWISAKNATRQSKFFFYQQYDHWATTFLFTLRIHKPEVFGHFIFYIYSKASHFLRGFTV